MLFSIKQIAKVEMLRYLAEPRNILCRTFGFRVGVQWSFLVNPFEGVLGAMKIIMGMGGPYGCVLLYIYYQRFSQTFLVFLYQ
jgi:hypothetical protein